MLSKQNFKVGQRLTSKGFTLIEVMIVVVILGILAAVAIPNYTQHVTSSRRAEARSLLLQNAEYMHRFYSANYRYDLSLVNQAPVLPYTQSPPNGAATHLITLSTLNRNAFVLQMAPTGGFADARCGTLSLTNTGARSTSVSTDPAVVANCWR